MPSISRDLQIQLDHLMSEFRFSVSIIIQVLVVRVYASRALIVDCVGVFVVY